MPELLLIQGTAPVQCHTDVPVTAGDVLRTVCTHARRRVVGIALRPCVVRQTTIETDSHIQVCAVTILAIRHIKVMLG